MRPRFDAASLNNYRARIRQWFKCILQLDARYAEAPAIPHSGRSLDPGRRRLRPLGRPFQVAADLAEHHNSQCRVLVGLSAWLLLHQCDVDG